MKRLVAWALLAVVMALAGCGETSTESGLTLGTGTLHSYGGECQGIWLLRADSGRHYELSSLATEFRQQDLRVRFFLKKRTDMVSVCMVGEGADVISMSKL